MKDDKPLPKKTLDELEKEEARWPYPARRIRRDEEEMVRLLLAGLRDKNGYPFVIVTDLDLIRDIGEGRAIRPEDEWRFYPNFCQYLQENVPGGAGLCHQGTVDNVKKCLLESKDGDEPYFLKEWPCHMGLRNLYISLAFEKKPIAYCAAGKFCHEEDKGDIARKVDRLPERLPGISAFHLEDLKRLIHNIPIKPEPEINHLKEMLISGMEILKRLLKDNYEKNRRLYHRNSRGRLEEKLYPILQKSVKITDIEESKEVKDIIRRICRYLGTSYIAIFFSDLPESTGLELLVQNGLEGLKRTEVFYNWKKGGLEKKETKVLRWDYPPQAEKLKEGIRGSKSNLLAAADFIFPLELAGHYGMMVLGPFARKVDMVKDNELLNRLCYAVGLRLGSLALLNASAREAKEKTRAVTIPAHTVKHGLANIRSVLILINRMSMATDQSLVALRDKIQKAIIGGERSIEVLANFATTTLESPNAMMGLTPELQESHLHPEPVSPMVLIEQCMPLHTYRSQVEGKNIISDDLSLETLPGIWADPSILKLALDILIENAIKYTGKGKHINIKGEWPRGTEIVKILIQNMGLEIKAEEGEKIFEMGYRGEAPQIHLPDQKGYGIGLSQVKKIIEVHGGKIFVDCQKKGTRPWDYLVTFTIQLPTLMGRTLRM